MNKWEKFFDECIKEIAKEDIILDIGSGYPFQKEMSKYKELFKNSRYYSLDYTFKYKPDIVGDIQNLPLKDEAVDAVICKAVLEHVPEPQKAVEEMYRVLQDGGKLFAYLPFLYPYHGSVLYKDYYRFTKDGVYYLFSDFREVKVIEVRGLLGVINLLLPYTPKDFKISAFLDKFFSGGNNTSGYNVFAIK